MLLQGTFISYKELMKKIICSLFLVFFILLAGCQKTDNEEDIDSYLYEYDLSNPDEKAFAEFLDDDEGMDLDPYELPDNYVKSRNHTEKELVLYKMGRVANKEDLGKSTSSFFRAYSIGSHDKPYTISISFVYGDRRLKETVFILPPSDKEQTLYYCLKSYFLRLAFIENEKISALYEFDMNNFVGFKIYCDTFDQKVFGNHYRRKVDPTAIVDKYLYYLRTEDEEKTEDYRTDKKLFVTIEAEEAK